jgi:succinate-semialdehyde dehydrogenase/glutarate-semialdehyde dehydrogenase
MLISINPYTDEIIGEYPEHTIPQLDTILETSVGAFQHWKNVSIRERVSFFYTTAEFLRTHHRKYAMLITAEMGKPLKESLAEIEKCALACIYYADNAEAFLQNQKIPTDADESYLVFEPLGTVLALMPWNFPFWQVFRCVVPAMLAGNTAVVKLAPNTTGCAEAIESIFKQVGFPEGVFQIVKIQNEATAYLLAQPAIKAVSLTGSERAGAIVAAKAGENLKKTLLELGGSDPFIVLEDADLDYTAVMAVKARLQNAGQSCIAAKRFIVQCTVARRFLELLEEKLQQVRLGDPVLDTTDMGPMARKDLKQNLLAQVRQSLQMGATLAYGSLPEQDDAFFAPVVLTNLKPGMPAYEEELFGPVFSFFEVQDEHEAVRIANESKYGLGASVWTKNIEKAKRLSTQLESGMVFINDFVRSDIRLPFGGVKFSGYGRELSEYGMKEFVNIKTVYLKV